MILQRLAARATAATPITTTLPLCRAVLPAQRSVPPTPSLRPYSSSSSSSSAAYPTVTDRGFWKSLIPKPLRRENRPARRKGQARPWNPATYFIVMFLFVGSMSIQMIALRNQTGRHMRQASVRLQRLREVVERVQAGEDVDVEKVLGTGEPQREADWEEVLQAIEREEAMKKSTPKDAPKPKSAAAPQPTTPAATPQPSAEQKSTKSTGFGSFF
ncbi:hypothetical protein ISF_08767 [Cordyceps fumosorosea ARSEF 2679]|uniref:Uncharacterized protein n=1 Tax=Cordyceps fumosorosea (strain ARSEF 2679) TaxID=1081104 RepID=A0A167LRP6_CORFA|nr:hypothetical protein ISF_08767 [Cordyceps fumosorosea ARSEF 2679]OAA53414.1 hypothetical protein ISF_08767 [Cordyceps fumosorosea ARSEF 2679]